MRMNQPFIVITGAAGMIGSGVVRYLNDIGIDQLLLVDDLGQDEKWKNLVGKRFINLISRHKIFEYLKGRENEIEAILHLGACSNTTEKNADYLLENNFHFSIQLAALALKENKRFIYASSAATYGDGSLGFSDDENRLSDLRPLNMYGYSKHLVDLWMQRENVLKNVVGLKYFNVFGPNEYHKGKMTSFILKMFDHLKSGEPLKLFQSNDPKRYADGQQCRDFIYLKDAVRMTCAFLKPEFSHVGGIFNIGLGETTTWNQMALHLFDSLSQTPRISYVPMPEILSAQYQNYTCADMRKFHSIFSHCKETMARTSMKEAVSDYVSSYLQKNDRW